MQRVTSTELRTNRSRDIEVLVAAVVVLYGVRVMERESKQRRSSSCSSGSVIAMPAIVQATALYCMLVIKMDVVRVYICGLHLYIERSAGLLMAC